MSETIDALLDPEQYREARAHIFPSDQSFVWFRRKHRAELVQAGALLRIRDRWKIDPSKFDTTVLQIGAQAAQKAAA